MLNKIKKEYKRFIAREFKKTNESYADYMNYLQKKGDMADMSYECNFGQIWKNYFNENTNQIEQNFENLNKNLDELSIKIARLVWNRFLYLIPFHEFCPSNSLFYDRTLFCTIEELQEQNEFRKITPNFKHEYKLPVNDFEVSVFGLHHGLKYLPNYVISSLKNKDFIDIGAFVGDSALMFQTYNPRTVYCFEPDKKNFEYIQKTCELNGLTNIKSYNVGLGDKQGEVILAGNYNTFSMNEEIKNLNQNAGYSVILNTLDNFTEMNNICPSLIKLDVEGFELECIKGGIETIKRHKPVLLISIYHHPKDFFEIKPLLESLDLGYKFMIRKTNPFSLTYETMLLAFSSQP